MYQVATPTLCHTVVTCGLFMRDPQQGHEQSGRHECLCNLVAGTSAGCAVLLHGLQLGGFESFAQHWFWPLRWPHDFHSWLLESVAWALVVGALLARRYGNQAREWWQAQLPLAKALSLAGLMVVIETFFAVGFWLTWPYGVAELGWLRAFFYVGSEHRPAALFSALQLGLAGWLAWRCYAAERHVAWLAGAVLCFYLATDEWFGIHEFIGIAARQLAVLGIARAALEAEGVIVYGWQIVFLPVVLVVGALLFRAFWRITNGAELAWLVAGAGVFLGGALGFESAEAHGVSTDAAWWASARAHAILLAEETMEMLGVTIVVGVFARRWFAGTAVGADLVMHSVCSGPRA
jgi:hypothetical protein